MFEHRADFFQTQYPIPDLMYKNDLKISKVSRVEEVKFEVVEAFDCAVPWIEIGLIYQIRSQ